MKTVIACVDFSPLTDAIILTALDLAHASHGAVCLLHVTSIFPTLVRTRTSAGPVFAPDQSAGERVRQARAQLEALQTRFANPEIPITALLFEGLPVENILVEAAKRNADALVVGAHGFGLQRPLFAGSTALGILQQARCPVVIVPAAKAYQNELPAHARA